MGDKERDDAGGSRREAGSTNQKRPRRGRWRRLRQSQPPMGRRTILVGRIRTRQRSGRLSHAHDNRRGMGIREILAGERPGHGEERHGGMGRERPLGTRRDAAEVSGCRGDDGRWEEGGRDRTGRRGEVARSHDRQGGLVEGGWPCFFLPRRLFSSIAHSLRCPQHPIDCFSHPPTT